MSFYIISTLVLSPTSGHCDLEYCSEHGSVNGTYWLLPVHFTDEEAPQTTCPIPKAYPDPQHQPAVYKGETRKQELKLSLYIITSSFLQAVQDGIHGSHFIPTTIL